MGLKSLEYHRQIKLEKRKRNSMSKHIEHLLAIELKEKLDKLLDDADKTLLEVNSKVVGEFLNILSSNILTMYDYEQVDENKFIFFNKEIEI